MDISKRFRESHSSVDKCGDGLCCWKRQSLCLAVAVVAQGTVARDRGTDFPFEVLMFQ
jgi:hypothetical protein